MDESNAEIVIIVLVYGFPVFLAIGALVIGRHLEKNHFQSIREREAATQHYPVVPTRTWDSDYQVADFQLVSASVVVSLDYFKRILAGFRNIFGGNIRSYESLLDRAKREAILRLKEQAPNCHIIVNLRLVTSNIVSVHTQRKGLGGVEVLAFGTAIRYAADSRQPAA